MGVLSSIQTAIRNAAVPAIGAAVFLLAGAPRAAEGPNLPPAPYKAPLVDTVVNFFTAGGNPGWYRVTESAGYEFVTASHKNIWRRWYAMFGKTGNNQYTFHHARANDDWRAKYDDGNRSALERLWPLKIGNKAVIEFDESNDVGGNSERSRHWRVVIKVVRTEYLTVNDKTYATYVIEERAHAGAAEPKGPNAGDYVETVWYHPDAGLIVKRMKEVKGHNSRLGLDRGFSVHRVDFPDGTTDRALTVVTPPAVASATDKALLAEVELQKRKAEEAEKARLAEVARLKQEAKEAETARLAELARQKRQAEEAEKARLAEVARLKREAREAEKARLAEIARLKKEAEEARAAGGTQTDEATAAEIARLEKEVEQRHWESVRDSQDLAAVEEYLKRYPKGRYGAEAKARVAVLQRLASADKIDFGNYHALVIGINGYKHLPMLATAVVDAKAVAEVLEKDYGFKVKLLIDPTRLDIVDAFDTYRENLGARDNLLIYYAGHGWLDEELDRGYWLPVDAEPKRRGRWLSNATITDTLKGLAARHVMVVADSCYSGTLTRAATDMGTRHRTGDYWKQMAEKFSRVAITSGGIEPVADKGGGKHSPFAKAFIDALEANDAILEGAQLFTKMRRPVMVAADQTPRYADVRNAGHDGGDFLFVRKKK